MSPSIALRFLHLYSQTRPIIAVTPTNVTAAAIPPVSDALSEECVNDVGIKVYAVSSNGDSRDGFVIVFGVDTDKMRILSVLEDKVVKNVVATSSEVDVINEGATGVVDWESTSTAVDSIVESVTAIDNWAGISATKDLVVVGVTAIENWAGVSKEVECRIEKLESESIALVSG
jgi:hypothetical protein